MHRISLTGFCCSRYVRLFQGPKKKEGRLVGLVTWFFRGEKFVFGWFLLVDLQFALFAPFHVLCGLLLDWRLVLLLAQTDGHEGVVGSMFSLDVQPLGSFHWNQSKKQCSQSIYLSIYLSGRKRESITYPELGRVLDSTFWKNIFVGWAPGATPATKSSVSFLCICCQDESTFRLWSVLHAQIVETCLKKGSKIWYDRSNKS